MPTETMIQCNADVKVELKGEKIGKTEQIMSEQKVL